MARTAPTEFKLTETQNAGVHRSGWSCSTTAPAGRLYDQSNGAEHEAKRRNGNAKHLLLLIGRGTFQKQQVRAKQQKKCAACD